MAAATDEKFINLAGGTIDERIIKKLKKIIPASVYISHLSKLMEGEYADDFEYVVIAGGAAEANRAFFDMITRSFAFASSKYPQVAIGDSYGMREHATYMQNLKTCQVSVLEPDVRTRQFTQLSGNIRKTTCLVSVANSCTITGEIRDLTELSDMCREKSIIFHVDITDSAGFLDINPRKIGINAFTIDFSRLGGSIGATILAIDKAVIEGYEITPILGNVAGGTLATCYHSLNFAIQNRDINIKNAMALKTYLVEELKKKFPDVKLISFVNCLPNVATVQFCVPMYIPDNIIIANKNKDSDVFKIMLSPSNSNKDVDAFVQLLTTKKY